MLSGKRYESLKSKRNVTFLDRITSIFFNQKMNNANRLACQIGIFGCGESLIDTWKTIDAVFRPREPLW